VSVQQVLLGYGATGGDPYWASVVSLLHFDGTNGSTTFTDQTGKTWTAQNGAHIDTATPLFGTAAGVFAGGGSNDHISTPDDASWEFAGDYTLEGAINTGTVSGNEVILAKTPGGGAFASWLIFRVGADLQFYSSSNGSSWDIVSALSIGTVTINTYHRWAVTRSGNNYYTHMDGVYANTATSSLTPINNNGAVRIASYDGISFAYAGFVDEFRATAAARYTNANYTLAAAAFPNS
jgi:hypothetical protein